MGEPRHHSPNWQMWAALLSGIVCGYALLMGLLLFNS